MNDAADASPRDAALDAAVSEVSSDSGSGDVGASADGPSDAPSCLPRPSGLIGWWRGEGDGVDTIGGKDATPSGTAAFAPGEVGQAFALSGAWFESAPFTYSGAFSVDLWAKATSISQVLFTSVISTGAPAHYDPFFQIMMNGAGSWAMDVGTGTDEITPVFGTATTGFQHLAMTFDGSSTIKLFLDGQLGASATWTGAMPLAFEQLKVGTNRDQNLSFSGLIDEVHVFNRTLTPAEVESIFEAGDLGLCPP